MDKHTAADKAAEHRDQAEQYEREAAASWDRSDTDGFVSQWAYRTLAREERLKADVAEKGGRWEFPALFDLAGNLVAAKLIETKYGPRWGVLSSDDPRSTVAAWLTAYPVRKSTLERKGYREGVVLAPAVVKIGGSGRGLAGAMSVSVGVERTDQGFSRDVEIVSTGQD